MKCLFLVAPLLLIVGNAFAQSESFALEGKSIFSRTGVEPGPTTKKIIGIGGDPGTIPHSRPMPQLLGVISDDQHYSAVFKIGESTQTFIVGDTVAFDQSRVVEITMEGVKLSNGKVIALGNDLLNRQMHFSGTPQIAPQSLPPSGSLSVGPRPQLRTVGVQSLPPGRTN